ncbi:hypothetical protein CH063_01825 [Colletotrichum higginsianum]|uniref:F-box domain-containing protein n=2 Tax=Colletotrichum higginsianum TaxID=80884 RepID=H1VCV4_COLHI|nr:F-box domain-containing protein [Colletotrichum higginsianum IMI 349063]OBR07525.1 F-box domain-containing protein [Colletotrichum higginsianum IMI 349063]TIC92760.1 hypothetical protein CH35J_010482 [Colletotrichum higginsianum]GJC98359.1 F-box domain-containing protein [Colletotrichum higginsianum]CCF38057.1 hypothetical protein CH063_01825 [Colletotrichum higginsianum]
MASGALQTGCVAPPAALNAMPIEILDLILAPLPPVQLWRLRRVSKRFNAILHRRLLSTLRAKADPLPLTLIKDTAPVPLSFIYNLVLAILGEDEGRKLWGKIFPSRDTSPENPHSSWLPATPPPLSTPSLLDPDPSVATVCRQNQLRAYPDLFAPHLRASSPSLANLRRIHFWSILLWYKEWSSVSADAQTEAARKRRLRWAYKQDRNNYEKRPGDTPAIVEEFTRTYILRHHFDQPPPTPPARERGSLHMRSVLPPYSGRRLPGPKHWVYGVTMRDRPTDFRIPFRMRRRPRHDDEYYEVRELVFANLADVERDG